MPIYRAILAISKTILKGNVYLTLTLLLFLPYLIEG